MLLWRVCEQGRYQYTGGKESWEEVTRIAAGCDDFLLDDEDELISDEDRSCYNCRFRRWTRDSFICMRLER